LNSPSLNPNFFKVLITNKLQPIFRKTQHNKSKQKRNKNNDEGPTTEIQINDILTKKRLSKKKIITYLYEVETSTDTEEVLKSWIIYHLEERKNAISTAITYLGAVKGFVKQIRKNKIDIYDDINVDRLLKQLKEQEKLTDTQVGVLAPFYKYGMHLYDFPKIPFFKNIKTKSDGLVRAGFISENIFQNFISDYKSKSNDSIVFKEIMVFIFFVLFRSGLRIGELQKLRIRDVELHNSEFCKDIWIYIRSSQKGKNKTRSGYRRIPLGTLLKDDEKKLFIGYFNKVSFKANVDLCSPVFSWDIKKRDPISSNTIYNVFRQHLSSKFDIPFVVHLFRHTAISRIFAILTLDTRLISLTSVYSKEQIEEIRIKLGLVDKNAMWSLAKFAGHASPAMTFSTYIHFTDYYLYSVLSQRNEKYSKYELAIRSGCSSQYLSYYLNELSDGSSIDLTKVNDLIYASLSKFSKKIGKRKEISNTFVESEYKHNNNHSLEDIYIVLKAIENGESIPTTSDQLKIDIEDVRRWFSNAISLSFIKNRKGFSKFFSINKKPTVCGYHLCPTLPPSNIEIGKSKSIFSKSIEVFENQPKEFLQSIKYFIKNCTYSKPELIFTDPKDLQNFLDIIQNFFYKKNITLYLNPLKGPLINSPDKIWTDCVSGKGKLIVLDEVINQRHKFPYGKITLKILHPNNEKKIETAHKKEISINAFHSHTLTYVFHMFAIKYLNLKK
jgi:integrase